MSLIRLANGEKFEIEQPNEGQGLMRNRQRQTLALVFKAESDSFEHIKAVFTPENLETFNIYYPDNETADEPDEQLEGVSHKIFEGYTMIGEWIDKEIEVSKETRNSAAVYARQLSVTLGERLMSDTEAVQ